MKIGIIYATRGGTTRECANLLARELKNDDVSLLEIGKNDICLDGFDIVVLGFPIRMAKAAREARKFIKQNKEKLSSINAAYFICCGFTDCFEEYAEKTIPAPLYERALAISCFGGSLDHTRFRGFDRLLVKTIRDEILGGGDNADQRSDMSLPTIFEANIAQFVNELKGKI